MSTDSRRLFRSDASGNVVLPATAVLSALPEQVSSRHGELGLVRQANWRRIAGESPAEGRNNQPPFTPSHAPVAVRRPVKR